ncbi:MAG: hypothetical protein WED86_04050 [Chloroflexota bacterium]
MRETRSTGGSWIVCDAVTREIVRGRIDCPRRGLVLVSQCLDCHRLETLEEERDPRLSCATDGLAWPSEAAR